MQSENALGETLHLQLAARREGTVAPALRKPRHVVLGLAVTDQQELLDHHDPLRSSKDCAVISLGFSIARISSMVVATAATVALRPEDFRELALAWAAESRYAPVAPQANLP